LYTLAVPTALVLDVGYKEAVLIPVIEGIPVLPAYQALALAGEAVDRYVISSGVIQILKHLYSFSSSGVIQISTVSASSNNIIALVI
jgi:actin-related protein